MRMHCLLLAGYARTQRNPSGTISISLQKRFTGRLNLCGCSIRLSLLISKEGAVHWSYFARGLRPLRCSKMSIPFWSSSEGFGSLNLDQVGRVPRQQKLNFLIQSSEVLSGKGGQSRTSREFWMPFRTWANQLSDSHRFWPYMKCILRNSYSDGSRNYTR